jgi:hypothetical protein
LLIKVHIIVVDCTASTPAVDYAVSIKMLADLGITASKLSFKPNTAISFGTDIAETTYFALPTATTASVIQLKFRAPYNGKTFVVQIDGSFYTGTFSQTTGQTSDAPDSLTLVTDVVAQTL